MTSSGIGTGNLSTEVKLRTYLVAMPVDKIVGIFTNLLNNISFRRRPISVLLPALGRFPNNQTIGGKLYIAENNK